MRLDYHPEAAREYERSVQAAIFPFQVLYRVTEERIVILAVMHESRNPDYWTDRMN